MSAPFIKPVLDRSRGLCSLWDIMINFNMKGVCFIIKTLYREEELRAAIAGTVVGHPSAMMKAVMGRKRQHTFTCLAATKIEYQEFLHMLPDWPISFNYRRSMIG
jgi:hypothetical protein